MSILVLFALGRCEEWCVYPCAELNGNVAAECSECKPPTLCHPGSIGYPSYEPQQSYLPPRPSSAPTRIAEREASELPMRNLSFGMGQVLIYDDAVPEALLHEWRGTLSSIRAGCGYDHNDSMYDAFEGVHKPENPVIVLHPANAKLNVCLPPSPLFAAIITRMRQLIAPLNAEEPLKLYRVSVNFIESSSAGYLHRDGDMAGALTALWYVNQDWSLQWGGELMLYDYSLPNEIAPRFFTNMQPEESRALHRAISRSPTYAVPPLTNRVVVMDARILHATRPPQESGRERLSVAFKFNPSVETVATSQ